MAWTVTSNSKGMYIASEEKSLPSTGTGYSSVIEDVAPDFSKNNRYVTFTFKASAVSGTNLDIALYGSDTKDGSSKVLLKDAVVADITDANEYAGQVDLNAYPAPYYFLGWTVDSDESANTITVKVFG